MLQLNLIPPPIHTESVTASDQIQRRQMVGQLLDLNGGNLNPSDANLKTAGVTVLLIASVGMLLAIRNPKLALGIMTGTLGASILGGYIALTAVSPSYTALNSSSSSS